MPKIGIFKCSDELKRKYIRRKLVDLMDNWIARLNLLNADCEKKVRENVRVSSNHLIDFVDLCINNIVVASFVRVPKLFGCGSYMLVKLYNIKLQKTNKFAAYADMYAVANQKFDISDNVEDIVFNDSCTFKQLMDMIVDRDRAIKFFVSRSEKICLACKLHQVSSSYRIWHHVRSIMARPQETMNWITRMARIYDKRGN